MFKAMDRRCVKPPMLLTSRTDAASLRRNRELQFLNGLNTAPFYCADVARQWALEAGEKTWARYLCFLYNASAVRHLVIAYLRDDWFFPTINHHRFSYRLASKVGLDFALEDTERQFVADSNPHALSPWI